MSDKDIKILLITYFYEPLNNVAAERWGRLVPHLVSEFDVNVICASWGGRQALNAVSIVDPIGEDQKKLNKNNLEKKPSIGSAFKAFVKKIVPRFLLIDGKVVWSILACFELSRQIRTARTQGKTPKVIVSGTPWSSVVAIAIYCRIFKIPYFVDFRDLWSKDPFLKHGSWVARKYFSFFESVILRAASGFFTVNEYLLEFFSKVNPTLRGVVLSNGFERELSWTEVQFNSIDKAQDVLYAGSLAHYHGLLKVLPLLLEQKKIRFLFLGQDFIGASSFWEKASNLVHVDAVSSSEAKIKMREAKILLLTIDSGGVGYTTGKIFSYIEAGRPILFIGPKNASAAMLVREFDLGWVCDIENSDQIKETLEMIAKHISQNKPFSFSPKISELQRFSAKNRAAQLKKILLR